MKFFKTYLSFVALIAISFIVSCNIEPYESEISGQENPITNFDTGTFKVDFDGKTFTANNVVVSFLDNVINIVGLKTSTNEAVILTIFGNTKGTYQVGVVENEVEINGATYNTNVSGTGETWIAVTDFITSQGEITITEIDEVNKTITGTFSFTAFDVLTKDSKQFTEGVFNKISYSSDISSGSSSNSFFAKVDGVEFVEDGIQALSVSLPGMSSIGISAVKNSIETISISVNSDIVPGEYAFTSFDSPMGQYILSLTDAYVSDDGGKLIITEHDVDNKRIAGTFEFVASPALGGDESYEITEGSFDVTYN